MATAIRVVNAAPGWPPQGNSHVQGTDQGDEAAEATAARAFTVSLPGGSGSDWTFRTWARTPEQAARQVCDWQGIQTQFVRAVSPDA